MSGIKERLDLVLKSRNTIRSGLSFVLYIFISLSLPFFVFYIANVHLWRTPFNPVDYLLKPFILVPLAYFLLKVLVCWTSHVLNIMLKIIANRVLRCFAASFILTFLTYALLNIYYFNIIFNPIDFIIKPFLIIPAASLVLSLIEEWSKLILHHSKMLRFRIDHSHGKVSLKLIEKPLPIYILDEDHLSEIQTNGTIVDMRIKNHGLLPLAREAEIIKLHQQQGNISKLVAKANQMIQNTAMKNKPITFIIDTKKDRSRTISKIWLRLIRNPRSKSANTDIHTILKMVY